MFFRKKERIKEKLEDPATKYGRLLCKKKGRKEETGNKRSFLARIFRRGDDRDFVYHEE
jgi:hypothetical protein